MDDYFNVGSLVDAYLEAQMSACPNKLCQDGYVKVGAVDVERCWECASQAGEKLHGDRGPRVLGEAILALKAGWRWSSDHQCYVRLSWAKGGFLVEAAGPGYLSEDAAGGKLIHWWEDPMLLRMIRPLNSILEYHAKVQQLSWTVGPDGLVVKS